MENRHKGTKAFSLAVGVSFAMVLIACIVAYPQVLSPDVDDQLAEVSETESDATTEPSPQVDPVDNLVTNVPKETTLEATSEPTTPPTDATTVEAATEPYVEPSESLLPTLPIADGEVLAEYSDGELVKSSTSGIWQTHNGVDFSAEVDTPVQSVADGTVTRVYEDALLGVCVSVDHTYYTANYCNLGVGVLVSEGDTVERGDVIGTVGSTSVSEASLESHLHFETLEGGKYVDPLQTIQQN